MRLAVNYVTTYHYDEPAQRVIQLLRVAPQSFPGQSVVEWRLDVDCDARIRENRDGYGNIIHMLYVDRPTERMKISVTGKVLTEDRAGLVQNLPHDLPPQVFLRPTPLTRAGPGIRARAAALEAAGGTVLDQLHELAGGIYRDLTFEVAATGTQTTADDAHEAGHGVCQDFAHIFIAAARCMGVPARYISGHLYRRDGNMLQEAAHAWVEAWVEDLGWTAFDPTNGICADDAYIRVACGLDYRDAAPFAGARTGGAGETLDVAVEVRQARVQKQAQYQSQS